LRAAAAKLREWREDPVQFVREVFQVEPDAWQVKALRAFRQQKRLAVVACKGPGKSAFQAWLGWNFLATRLHPKVVATSITGDNLRDGLWTEYAKWQQRSPLLKKAFKWSAERIVAVDHPQTWWASARQWSRGADASQQADTFAGIHADNVFVQVDEAGGVPNGLVAAAEGNLSTGEDTKLVLTGNPTELDGPLYRASTQDRELYHVIHISSDPDDPDRTPRVPVEWAREQIRLYGYDSDYVRINVRGLFPKGQANSLISLDDAMRSSKRQPTAQEYAGAPKILGVDVARFGDDTTELCPRQGRVAMRLRTLRSRSTMEVAGAVVLAIKRWEPDAVFIDQTGIGGGVVDRLLELGHKVVGVDAAASPLESERFLNLRAEMWWQMGDWLKNGGCVPDDNGLVGELAGPRYKFRSDGKMQLEAKEDMKKRGVPSPNKADALALTFAMPVAARAAHPSMERERHRVVTDFDPYAEERLNPQRGRAVVDFDPFSERTW
jgi:phage terminase large subunit